MNYRVCITNKAINDISKAADYIEYTLLKRQAADALLDKVEAELNKLSFMPGRHPIVDDPVLHSWGIRFISIDNYLAFYIIDEKSGIVYIIRFLYGKRNWRFILGNDEIVPS